MLPVHGFLESKKTCTALFLRMALFALCVSLLPGVAASRDWLVVWINPGQNVDIYTQVNMSGRIFVAADIGGNPACLNYWWITWPLGRIEDLGRHCGRAAFDVPGWSSLTISSRLRAGGAEAPTRVQGSAIEAIALGFPNIRF